MSRTETRRLIHDPDGLNSATWPLAGDQLITPIDQFFTRSHGAIPRIDARTWRLQVGGLVESPAGFSLDQLRQDFPQHHSTATLICAGLRRKEFLTLGPLPGELPWGPEPASTGRWSGVLLRDVLKTVGIDQAAQHVEFVGLDQVERHGKRFGFGGSIDLTKGLQDDVLLATELNGMSLPAVHGFPLRVVVPGWIGARSVKWLGSINLREAPSTNYFHSEAYRFQREIDPRRPRDVSAGLALSEIFLNSVILNPTAGETVPSGKILVNGWAIGAGGRELTRVEVSADAGTHWTPAVITNSGPRGSWSYWEATLNLRPGQHTLVVRASDFTGVPQPENVNSTWNVKGYCNNAWHRVMIVSL